MSATIAILSVFILTASAGVLYNRNQQVVFMHGVCAGVEEWDIFDDLVQKNFPGMRTVKVSAFTNESSIAPLTEQANKIAETLKSVLTDRSTSTVLVCYSQGGLICRGVLARLKHNVETFISLSSPQAGQWGGPSIGFLVDRDTSTKPSAETPHMSNETRHWLTGFFYSWFGDRVSIAGYWNDPHQQDKYRYWSTYLAVLNNESDSSNPHSHEWKDNFLRLDKLVLVGGPDDGVITPWQSSHFDYFNTEEKVLPMFEQQFYKKDAFGLKTLYERGAVKRITIPNKQHHHWHLDEDVFNTTILPYLRYEKQKSLAFSVSVV